MRPGMMRRKIAIQEQSRADDDMGGKTLTWSEFATVWASIEPLRMRERFEAEQIQNETTHQVKIRYRSGITPDMRIKFGTRYFYIESIVNFEERNRELILMSREDV